jgi:hypothetical protein
MTLKGSWARVDFSTGIYDVKLSNVVNIPIDTTSNNIVLTPPGIPSGFGTSLYLIQIEFYQEINAAQYSLKNGTYNALSIVEVA